MASSPTKIAESIGCGVPVICNKNVGDTNDLFKDNPLLLVNAHSEDSLIKKAIEIKNNFSINKYDFRDQFMNRLALEVAKNNYIKAYKYLLN
jgi:glycosyltransferase involved in cell wall biosynthesis